MVARSAPGTQTHTEVRSSFVVNILIDVVRLGFGPLDSTRPDHNPNPNPTRKTALLRGPSELVGVDRYYGITVPLCVFFTLTDQKVNYETAPYL